MPESPRLYEWMTVAEIGWFAAAFYDTGFLERYTGLAKRFELPWDRKLKALSKGRCAKVALSLAMAHEPDLLVLDEPTSGLDPLVRREFLESMVDWTAAGRTVLLSSHQIDEVERVADWVAILRRGEVLVVERLDELKKQIQELTVTLADGAEPPLPGGEVLWSGHKARQSQFFIRHLPEGSLAALRDNPAVREIQVRSPGLEEIFVAYMRSVQRDYIGDSTGQTDVRTEESPL